MVKKSKQKNNQPTQPKHWRRLRWLVRHWRQWNIRKRVMVVCVSLVVTAAIIFCLLAAMTAAILTGFPFNLPREINPYSQHIMAARKNAANGNDQREVVLTAGSSLKRYARATRDICFRGQHNYAVNDSYSSKCTLTTAYYYGLGANYKTALQEIDRNLKQKGWKEPLSERNRAPGEPAWDEHYLATDSSPDSVSTIGVNGYTEGKYELSIKVESKNQKRGEVAEPEGGGEAFGDLYEQDSFVDGIKTFDAIAKDNSYVVTIMISNTYATKPSMRDGLF